MDEEEILEITFNGQLCSINFIVILFIGLLLGLDVA